MYGHLTVFYMLRLTKDAGGIVAGKSPSGILATGLVVLCAFLVLQCGEEEGCLDGQVKCDGKCVDPGSDEPNCGECGNDCGEHSLCSRGECTCTDDFEMCDSGCVPLLWDRDNCGECNRKCDSEYLCLNGACCHGGYPNCVDFGFDECKNADGCPICTSTDSDLDHCGQCDNACAQDEECVDGVCE